MQRNQIEKRKHARLAIAHLECLLEEFVGEQEEYSIMAEKIEKFKKWIFEASPVA